MSLAEPVLAETQAETQMKNPKPGKYKVKSTGAPIEVPFGADVDIDVLDVGEAVLKVAGQVRGPIVSLANGDFKVTYQSGINTMVLQFRQTELTGPYLFGVSMPAEVQLQSKKAMDDPPITGIWGAETPPPNETYVDGR